MSLKQWAKNEVEIAKSINNDEYYNMCLDAALEAFNILCDQGHSGMSFGVTAGILNRLIETKPLSPIDDAPDVWNEVGTNAHQCKRYSGLFKDIIDGGTEQCVTYNDVNRFVCYDDSNPELPFHNGLVSRVLNQVFPIDFPYTPTRFKVMVHESLVDPRNGDFDTILIVKVILPNGEEQIINRLFTEKEGQFVEVEHL